MFTLPTPRHRTSSVFATLAALACLSLPLHAQTAPTVYHGRQSKTTVAAPRLSATTTVDGALSEPVWQQAAQLTGFSQFFPNDGTPAADSTDVLLWYSATHVHVGVRAYAPEGSVRATLADRDRIAQDDNIQLFLGTYNDSRQALVFGVNPFGIQSDGVINETGTVTGGGFSGAIPKAREAVDLAPDYVWRSKGRLTDFGYEVEIEIPVKSLRYRADDVLTWQLHIVRTVQARGQEYSWAPAVRAGSSFLAQAGVMTGMRDLARGLTLDMIPTVTSSTLGAREGNGWAYRTPTPELGASVRWGITSNLTFSGTVLPDFSQVESDATQFQYDPRVAVFYPERRPFFLESQEQFAVPNRLIYTRRIVQPAASAKVAGKVGGFDVGFLSAVDRASLYPDTVAPISNILRLQRDIGKQSRIGLVYTDRRQGSVSNHVLGVDTRFASGIYSLQAQVVGSRTSSAAGAVTAPLYDVSLNVLGSKFNAIYRVRGNSPDFSAQLGFIARPGISDVQATHRYTIFRPSGSFIEAFTPEVFLSGTFRFADFAGGRPALEEKLHLRTSTRFRGGWVLSAQSLIELFRYDSTLYRNYVLLPPRAGGGVDTVRFNGAQRFTNLDWVGSLTSPELKRLQFNLLAIYGRDQNFPEWSAAIIRSLGGGLTLRPTEQLRSTLTWTYDAFDRYNDRTRVLSRSIPRLRVEYQVSRQIFVRYIGEINRQVRDSLRDEGRTMLPIFLRTRNGLERATAYDRHVHRHDILFSYLPNPGTVVYLGYGTGLVVDRPRGPIELERSSDAFFVKVSYLLRAR